DARALADRWRARPDLGTNSRSNATNADAGFAAAPARRDRLHRRSAWCAAVAGGPTDLGQSALSQLPAPHLPLAELAGIRRRLLVRRHIDRALQRRLPG